MEDKSPKQRGSELGYKILILLYRFFGYNFLHFFLFFIVSYYYARASDIREVTKKYYSNTGIKYSELLYFKHLYAFAVAILDRFVSSIHPELLKVKSTNSDSVRYGKDGSILLVSHFGSWGIAPNLLKFECPINIVMREAYGANIKEIVDNRDRDKVQAVRVIDLNDGFVALTKIANAIRSKEILGMMVDRVYDDARIVEATFCEKKIRLNRNPFELAIKMKVPVYTVFVVGSKNEGYEFIFSDRLVGQNEEELAMSYSKELEKMIRAFPMLWFNFYDFWSDEKH